MRGVDDRRVCLPAQLGFGGSAGLQIVEVFQE
jgi:hypothetical protein